MDLWDQNRFLCSRVGVETGTMSCILEQGFGVRFTTHGLSWKFLSFSCEKSVGAG